MSKTQTYVASSSLPVSAEAAFAYHDRQGALQRLIPPWESVAIEYSDHSLAVGSRVILKTSVFGIPVRWVAEHTHYDPPQRFVDIQVSGPFSAWKHQHDFLPAGQYCELNDTIEYDLPLGRLGRVFGGGKVQRTLESMFAYRHRITRDDLALSADHPSEPLRVALSGSSGLVGSQFRSLLTLLGHDVRPLVRSVANDEKEIAIWSDPDEADKLNGVDAVVHLAGKSIASGRWTDQLKKEIRDSRVEKTRQLCETLAQLSNKPKVLVCASATGIFGNRGDEELDEESAPGDDFLADVAQQWEQACQPAIDAGIRVVNARFGIVLSAVDGALSKMLTPAKFAGGSLGSGKQWWSWIALDDAIGALYHAIMTPTLEGPVNLVAPQPCTNAEFAKALAGVLRRPCLFPAPAFALKLALGEMAEALLLSSTRVHCNKLVESGYRFRFEELSEALRFSLGIERLASSV